MASPRASWKGHLKLALVSCPVRLFKASSDADRITLHLLHSETLNRIQMRPHDPVLGEVARSELVRGYEYEPGQHVVVTDEELDQLDFDSAKAIVIERFVEADAVDPIYLDQPYYLAPVGPLGEGPFRLIHEAMRRTRTVAIGRLTMAQRERPVVLQRRDRGLLLTTLRRAEEIRDPDPVFAEIGQGRLDETLLDLAVQLVEEQSGSFEPAMFEDHYQLALTELIKRKLAGQRLAPVRRKPPAELVDLLQALQQSLDHLRKPPAKSRPRRAAGSTARAQPTEARGESAEPARRGRRGSGTR